jgi:hypothetical protein
VSTQVNLPTDSPVWDEPFGATESRDDRRSAVSQMKDDDRTVQPSAEQAQGLAWRVSHRWYEEILDEGWLFVTGSVLPCVSPMCCVDRGHHKRCLMRH